jgi:polysaccharide biosynthesis/export protein
MRQQRTGRMLWVTEVLLVGGLIASGCQTTSPVGSLLSRGGSSLPPAKSAAGGTEAALIVPGTELAWEIETTQERPDLVRSGRGVVGPDGTLVLGPYGPCPVAGQSLQQARIGLEKYLSAHVKKPTVRLSTLLSEAPSREIAWRAVGSNSAQAGTMVAAVPRRENPIRTTGNWQEKDPGPFAPDKEPADGGPTLPPGKDDGLLLPPQAQPLVAPPAVTYQPLAPPPPLVSGPLVHAPVGMPPAPSELRRVILPPYVIGPPDVLQIASLLGLRTQLVAGPHLVRPDGTVMVGIYGSVLVAGSTVDQAKESIARAILARLDSEREDEERQWNKLSDEEKKERKKSPLLDYTLKDVVNNLNVDVLAYNSKVYYIVFDGGGYGDAVYSFPVTGNETVLDAISKLQGLSWNASKSHIWVARRTVGHGPEKKLPVDWLAITKCGRTDTNYQVMPGDRVYVQADQWRRADALIAKFLSPIERLFGVTLLSSQTVNSIRSGTVGGGGVR